MMELTWWFMILYLGIYFFILLFYFVSDSAKARSSLFFRRQSPTAFVLSYEPLIGWRHLAGLLHLEGGC